MSSLQSLSEDRCKENTFLFCEASITLISKSEKHKKRKLQTCLSHEHRCKNPQKYIRKSNLPMYQIRSVAQSCLTLCDPMNRSLPLKSRDITLSSKIHIVKAMVFPVVMYRCES